MNEGKLGSTSVVSDLSATIALKSSSLFCAPSEATTYSAILLPQAQALPLWVVGLAPLQR